MTEWTGNEFENITQKLVYIAKAGSQDVIDETIKIMEEGWKKMDEVLDPAWYNKEVMTLWKEYLKNKK